MSKTKKTKKRLLRDLRKLTRLIEKVDTPLKILHAKAKGSDRNTKSGSRP